MNGKTIGYWVATGLTALSMGMGGLMDLQRGPEMVAGMAKLGYPAYFLLLLGTWKVLAVPALLAPKLPRLKEWAYAGIAFDLTGAAFSHAAAGDAAGKVITPLVLLAIAAASWALRPDSRKLAAPSDSTPASGRAIAGAVAAAE